MIDKLWARFPSAWPEPPATAFLSSRRKTMTTLAVERVETVTINLEADEIGPITVDSATEEQIKEAAELLLNAYDKLWEEHNGDKALINYDMMKELVNVSAGQDMWMEDILTAFEQAMKARKLG
jgi:hypothetical protein